MLKRIFYCLLVILVAIPLWGTFNKSWDFLATAVDCGASTTLVNGVGFTSTQIEISRPQGMKDTGSLSVTFTRAAGSASTLDFEFQVSFDGGSSWSTAYYVRIRVATNETALTNVVKVTKELNLHGISHIRLYRIVNNDGANAVTACNATLSL